MQFLICVRNFGSPASGFGRQSLQGIQSGIKVMLVVDFFNNPASGWLSVAISLMIVIGYEIFLRAVGEKSPFRIAQRTHVWMRQTWVRKLMGLTGVEVVVIQTLRNSMMAASFMASTSILTLMGMLTLSGITTTPTHLSSFSMAEMENIKLVFKQILLALVFFASFFFNTMAVRYYTHAGYMISIGVGTNDLQQQAVAIAYLNRAGLQYSIGTKSFFYSFPVVASLFNTWFMVPATLFLVFLLYQFDRSAHYGAEPSVDIIQAR